MSNGDTFELNYKVTLRNASIPSEFVKFLASPEISESRSVVYRTTEIVHAPGQVLAYQQTQSRTFQINAIKLISRNSEEAEYNLRTLWIFRSWTMPRFGTSTLSSENRSERSKIPSMSYNADKLGAERRGEPPPVLLFSAYSTDSPVGGKSAVAEHINRVPVVVQSLTIPYPSDVDYIPTAVNKVPMPTIMSVDISLIESQAPVDYERFSLSQYKKGILRGF